MLVTKHSKPLMSIGLFTALTMGAFNAKKAVNPLLVYGKGFTQAKNRADASWTSLRQNGDWPPTKNSQGNYVLPAKKSRTARKPRAKGDLALDTTRKRIDSLRAQNRLPKLSSRTPKVKRSFSEVTSDRAKKLRTQNKLPPASTAKPSAMKLSAVNKATKPNQFSKKVNTRQSSKPTLSRAQQRNQNRISTTSTAKSPKPTKGAQRASTTNQFKQSTKSPKARKPSKAPKVNKPSKSPKPKP